MKTNLNTTGHIIVFNVNGKVTASSNDAKIMFPHRNLKGNDFAPISIYRVSDIIDKGTYAFFDGQPVQTELPDWKELEPCLSTLIECLSIANYGSISIFSELGMYMIFSKLENIIITKDSATKEVLMFVEPKYLDNNNTKSNPRYYGIYNSTKLCKDDYMPLSILISNILIAIDYKVDKRQMMYILETVMRNFSMEDTSDNYFGSMGYTSICRGFIMGVYTAYYCDDSDIPTVILLRIGNTLLKMEDNRSEWQSVADFMLENHIGPVTTDLFNNNIKIKSILLPNGDNADGINTAYIDNCNVGEFNVFGCKSQMLSMSVNGYYSRDLLDEDFLNRMDDEISNSYKLEDEHISYLKKCIRLGYKDPIKELKLHNYKQYYNLSSL